MAYVSPNYRTKKQLKEAVAAGKRVTVFEPGICSEPIPANGWVYGIDGPHSPKLHTWNADVRLENGQVVQVR